MSATLTVQDALAGIPALPMSVARVLEETGRDEPDPKAIATAIEGDPGLTAKLLAVVNSPYYGLNGSVTCLSQAVMIVGFRQVRNVALAVGALGNIPGIPEAVLDAFLCQALQTANVSRELAIRSGLGTPEVDVAHLGGLLRGVGYLVALRIGKKNVGQREIAFLAGTLLNHWKLPPAVVVAVGNSGVPETGPVSPTTAVFVSAMAYAGEIRKVDAPTFAKLRVSPSEVAKMIVPVG